MLAATSAIDHILGLLLPVCSSGDDTGDCVAAIVDPACTVFGAIDDAAVVDGFCGELLSVSKSLKSTKENCFV